MATLPIGRGYKEGGRITEMAKETRDFDYIIQLFRVFPPSDLAKW